MSTKHILIAAFFATMSFTQAKAQGIVVNKTDGTKNYYPEASVQCIETYGKGDDMAARSQTFTVNDVKFTMMKVEGGTFQMGATPEMGSDVSDEEKPVHQVTLSPYYIGQTEVTQELWYAVTGEKPSNSNWYPWTRFTFYGDQYPAFYLKWESIVSFIEKLNELTGQQFRLPTEAEWEFAARGGNKSHGYMFAGSNDIDEVAWWFGNSGGEYFHPVGLKKPNELGLYDMTGNVTEICSDWYGDYASAAVIDPTGPSSSEYNYHVVRGGSVSSDKSGASSNRISARWVYRTTEQRQDNGLRLALSDTTSATKATAPGIVVNKTDGTTASYSAAEVKDMTPYGYPKEVKTETFTVNGTSFTMVAVEGGTFNMGGTSEQGGAYDDEMPTHQVTLSSFCIGQTEVTQALWKAVMGYSPLLLTNEPWGKEQASGSRSSEPTSIGFNFATQVGDDYPAYYISWDDCQAFLKRLSGLTGRTFRMPTEAEWEYAARGGNKSKGYRFAGSNVIEEVASYNKHTHDKVGTKQPNELGLYDMSGSVFEWCSDWYGNYSPEAQTNPTGPETGQWRICRGGAANTIEDACRLSYRYGYTWHYRDGFVGLRLVLSD